MTHTKESKRNSQHKLFKQKLNMAFIFDYEFLLVTINVVDTYIYRRYFIMESLLILIKFVPLGIRLYFFDTSFKLVTRITNVEFIIQCSSDRFL